MKNLSLSIAALAMVLLSTMSLFAQDTIPSKPPADKPKEEKKKMIQMKGKDIAVVETSMGQFEIELYASDAPKTVENFLGLTKKKYFDGMRVHRVSKGFVIQTGDDKSKDPALAEQWGTGGSSLWGKDFADELDPKTPSSKEGYKKGVVAMANRGPNTNSSQFFVCLKDVGLPHNYTIFGKVVKGMDVVEKIGQVEIIPGQMGPTDGRPKQDVMVKNIRVKK
ncbi:MAG TPA: peptidylprolyl isomerase [Bacteroidota bacterium]|jgi:cyclophilin family peptidyl-prolyl cis-trans isomerase|nr:peptidylprolyl isomerase [Bacteroidota bacterium]